MQTIHSAGVPGALASPPPCPLVLVGKGRVGRALLRMANDPNPIVVDRGDSLRRRLDALSPPPLASAGRPAAAPAGPIYVTTTNDALEGVIADCPLERRPDLVLLQNGMLLPLLERHGLDTGATQALLYLSAAADGSYVDGGRTAVCGRCAERTRMGAWGLSCAPAAVCQPAPERCCPSAPLAPFRWAGALAELLHAGGVQCQVVGHDAYLALMLEKLLWSSTYWLLSAALGGLTVGAVAERHSGAAAELTSELLPLAQAYVGRWAARRGVPGAEQVSGVWDGAAAWASRSPPTPVPSASAQPLTRPLRHRWRR